MKIPKGGLHNINQSSQANINDSWNVLATDENNAVLIAVDKCGTKKTVGDTTEIKNSIQALEQENIEQDNKLNLLEQENQNQNTLISELRDDVTNLEGIHYTWSPTNRTLTLYDNNGKILSSVTFEVSNINGLQTALDGKLGKGGYEGTAQDLKNEIEGKASISHTHDISSITNLQTALNNKQDKLSSFDESVLIDSNGNIEGNVSLFQEYFQEQNCILNFTPIQIIGVYVNGIKQRPSLYTITLPKTISVANFTSGDYIEIQYTKLKN